MKTKKFKEKYREQKVQASHVIRTGSLLIFMLLGIAGHAQEAALTVSVSYDTVYLGNMIEVAYQYNNLSCEHSTPAFPEAGLLGAVRILVYKPRCLTAYKIVSRDIVII